MNRRRDKSDNSKGGKGNPRRAGSRFKEDSSKNNEGDGERSSSRATPDDCQRLDLNSPGEANMQDLVKLRKINPNDWLNIPPPLSEAS